MSKAQKSAKQMSEDMYNKFTKEYCDFCEADVHLRNCAKCGIEWAEQLIERERLKAQLEVLRRIYATRDRVEKPHTETYKSKWKCQIFPAVSAGTIEIEISKIEEQLK